MASVIKCKDVYRAQVYVKGTRDSKTFRTKREADAWASSRETFLREEAGKPISARFTFRELARKYGEEVSIKKRGKRWELIRIEAFIRAVTISCDSLAEGFNHFVSSIAAPVTSGWSNFAGWGFHPLGSAAFARRTPLLPVAARCANGRHVPTPDSPV